ncbi:MAG: hypothetical protein BWY25_02470 [Chloroflexi bacterium ADurb.Bin222]|nr:MAG: hypothetical protein BWY25_02470 [Chloroflexi bacterium ADurb.Bin222]
MQPATIVPPSALIKYQGAGISFSHPEGSKVIYFDHGDGEGAVRLVYNPDAQNRLRVTIERTKRYPSAKAAAEAVYAEASAIFKDENIPPYPIDAPGYSGWRCRKRFVEGGTAPLIIEHAFLEANAQIIQLTLAARPPAYEKGKWVLELLLQTIAFQ